MLQILIECLAKKVMGEMEPKAAKELTLCWRYFPRGWFRFSWNIPGNGVCRMMKVRVSLPHLTLLALCLEKESRRWCCVAGKKSDDEVTKGDGVEEESIRRGVWGVFQDHI